MVRHFNLRNLMDGLTADETFQEPSSSLACGQTTLSSSCAPEGRLWPRSGDRAQIQVTKVLTSQLRPRPTSPPGPLSVCHTEKPRARTMCWTKPPTQPLVNATSEGFRKEGGDSHFLRALMSCLHPKGQEITDRVALPPRQETPTTAGPLGGCLSGPPSTSVEVVTDIFQMWKV